MELIRILVVEDDPDFQYLIQQSLAAYDDLALITCCPDGETACQAARQEDPHIVLMDLALPSDPMEGVSAARRIRLETRAKVILLTSFDDPTTVIQASVEAFASAYVLPAGAYHSGNRPWSHPPVSPDLLGPAAAAHTGRADGVSAHAGDTGNPPLLRKDHCQPTDRGPA